MERPEEGLRGLLVLLVGLATCAGPTDSVQSEPGEPKLASDPCQEDPRRHALPLDGPRDFAKADAAFKNATQLADGGDYGAALVVFKEAVAADPTYGLAQLGIAEAHLYTDDDKVQMRKHLATALVLIPENPRAHERYASVLDALGEKETSARHWRCLLTRKPDAAEARYQLARLYLEAGAKKEAETELKAALEIEQTNLQYHLLLGDVLEADGRTREAAYEVATAAKIAGRSAPLHRRAGDLYEKAGQRPEADAQRRLADQIDPPEKERKLRPLREARGKKK